MLQIIFLILGAVAIIKGKFPISRHRKVSGSVGRSLGILMITTGALQFWVTSAVLPITTLVLVIAIGLAAAEDIQAPADASLDPWS